MIRQRCMQSTADLYLRFERMLWKRGFEFYNQFKPYGIQVEDLFQEGLLGIQDAIESFRDARGVGFAWFVSVCVDSRMRTLLRKCRSSNHRILDYSSSLEQYVTEDKSLQLGDMVQSTYFRYEPNTYAQIQEMDSVLSKLVQESLNDLERDIFVLRYRGYSYQEIAEKYSLSVKRVDNILQKISRMVRGVLN